MFSTVLVPLDGSQLAEDALRHAKALCTSFHHRTSCSVHLVMALAPPLLEASPRAAESISEARREEWEEAESYLRSLPIDAGNVKIHLVEGSAGEMILEIAEEENVDVIVMTSHGKSGLKRWIFGSTAERVLRYAPCPVMVVKAQEEG